MTTKTKYTPPFAASRYARYRPLLQATGGTNYAGISGLINRVRDQAQAGIEMARAAQSPAYYESMAEAKGTDPERERYEFLTTQTTGPLGAEAQAFIQDYQARMQRAQQVYDRVQSVLPTASRYARQLQMGAAFGDLERAQEQPEIGQAQIWDDTTGEYRPTRNLREVGLSTGAIRGDYGSIPDKIAEGYRAVRNPLNEAYRSVAAPVTDVATEALRGTQIGPVLDISERLGGPGRRAFAEVAVPQNVEQAALELVPGTGTVPDVYRGLKQAGPVLATGARTGAQAVGRGALQGLDDVLAQGAEAGIVRFPGGSVLNTLQDAVDDADLIGRLRSLDLQDQMKLTQELRDQPQLMQALKTAVNQANDAERVGSNALVGQFMRDTNRLRNRASRMSQAVDVLKGGEGGFATMPGRRITPQTLAKQREAFVKELTADERNALNVYNWTRYERINDGLRRGNRAVRSAFDLDEKEMRLVAALDSAAGKGTLPHATTLYRGLPGTGQLDDFTPGAIVRDRAFMSTATNEEAARVFALNTNAGPINSGILLEIAAPKGQRGAWMTGGVLNDPEFLLPRDTALEILEVVPEGTITRIRARIPTKPSRMSQAVDALRGGEGGYVRMGDDVPAPRFTPEEKASRALAQQKRLERSGAWPELMERANLESAAALDEDMVAQKVAEAGAKRWTEAAVAGGTVPPKTPKAYGQLSFGPEWAGKQATDLRDEITALLGLPRALKASFDLSAPGRQGLALAARHPVEWVQSWAPMLKAWRSAEGMADVNAEITKLLGRWQQQFGDDVLHIYDVGGQAPGLKRVPGFEGAGAGKIGDAIRKIPGLSKSERAYATFLNYQKAKTFDNMAGALYKSGERNPSVFKNLGNIIDHATGYGAAPLRGRIEGQALFSQRYMTSRLQFLVDPIVEGAIKGDWQTARAATENLVAFMGGGAALAMLINESGLAEVELDPRSSEFGKIRIGSQRIDFGAGFLPVLRTAARVATGTAETTTGSVYEINRKNEFLKFFRNKLAPLPSEVINRLVGENAIGEAPGKLLSLDTVRNLFMPLIADSILEAYKQTDDPLRAALAGVSELFGGGVSTYGADRSGQRDLAQEMFGREFDALDAWEQSQVNQQLIAEGVELEESARLSPYWEAWDTAYDRWRSETGMLSEYPTLESLRTELDKRIERTLREQGEEFTRRRVQAIRQSIEDDIGLTDVIHAVQEVVVEADPEIVRELLKRYEEGRAEFEPRKALKEIYEEWKAEQAQEPNRLFAGDIGSMSAGEPTGNSSGPYTGFSEAARLDPSQVEDRRRYQSGTGVRSGTMLGDWWWTRPQPGAPYGRPPKQMAGAR